MSIWNLFSLIGGLAIFIYGLLLMNKNLTAVAGEKMKSIMLSLTKSRPRGFFTGLVITMINQSSSATTVLEAALVSAGLMTFYQSVAVTLGAELGSTFLPHIIAFPSFTKFAPLLIALSVFIFIRLKQQKSINTALVFLGIGFLFLGLSMMLDSVKPLKSYQPFLDIMTRIETPILGVLLGCGFTMIIQSSGATCALAIALAVSGALTLEQALPITLGAAVGTSFKAIIASLALNWEAKRTAYFHVMSQLVGAVFIYILLVLRTPEGERVFIWLTKWVTAAVFRTDDLARQIATGFSMVPLIKIVIFFGTPKLLTLIVAIFDKVFPPRKREKPFSVTFLQEQLVEGSVDIALEMAKKEMLVSADLVKSMFERVDLAFKNKNINLIDKISETDSKVDLLYKAIIIFLAKISQKELGKDETKRSINYLYIEKELESIGDVIDKNLMVMAKKMINLNLSFSEQGSKELTELHGKVMDNINRMVEVLRDENFHLAKEMAEIYSDIDERKYQRLHIERLHKGLKVSIDTSSIHLDVINYYARINKHVVRIAEGIIWLAKEVSSNVA